MPRAAPVLPAAQQAFAVARWPIPRQLLAINDFSHGGLRLVVPTTSEELRRWGRALHSCLGDFSGAAANGHSWLIGVERDDHLIGCVEVQPATRRVRQALGPRNHPLPPNVAAAVFNALRLCGVTNQ